MISPLVHLVLQKLKNLGTGEGGFFSAVNDLLAPFHPDTTETKLPIAGRTAKSLL